MRIFKKHPFTLLFLLIHLCIINTLSAEVISSSFDVLTSFKDTPEKHEEIYKELEYYREMGDFQKSSNYESALEFLETAIQLSTSLIEISKDVEFRDSIQSYYYHLMTDIIELEISHFNNESALQKINMIEEELRNSDRYLPYYTILGQKAAIYINSSEFDSDLAMQYIDSILVNRDKFDHAVMIIGTLLNKAIILNERFQHQESLSYIEEALLINQKTVNKEDLKAWGWNLLAGSYYELDQYELSEEYYRKAEKVYLKLNNTLKLTNIYISLGAIKHIEEQTQKAEDLYLKAVNFAKKSNDHENLIVALSNLGLLFWSDGNLEKAEEYYKKTIAVTDSTAVWNTTSALYRNLALLSREKKEYEASVDYAMQSIEIAKKHKLIQFHNDALKTLAETEEERGNYAEALNYYRSHKLLTDSIYRMNLSEKIGELKQSIVNIEEQNRMELQDIEIERKTAEIKRKNTIIQALSGGGTLIITFIILSVVYLNRQKQSKFKIKSQEGVISKLQTKLSKQTGYIEDKNNLIIQLERSLKNIRSEQVTENKHLIEVFGKLFHAEDKYQKLRQNKGMFVQLLNDIANTRSHFHFFENTETIYLLYTDFKNISRLNVLYHVYIRYLLEKHVAQSPEINSQDLVNRVNEDFLKVFKSNYEKLEPGIKVIRIDKKSNKVEYYPDKINLFIAIAFNSDKKQTKITEYHELQKAVLNKTENPTGESSTLSNLSLKKKDRIYLLQVYGEGKLKQIITEDAERKLIEHINSNLHAEISKQESLHKQFLEQLEIENGENGVEIALLGIEL